MDIKIIANRLMWHWQKDVFRILIFSCSGLARAGTPECTIIDLMPKFWHVVDDSRHQSADQQVAEFRRVLGVDRTDLYSESGLGFESPEALNRAILKTVASARERPEPIESMGTLIESRLTSYIREFRKTFPDFECNFPIYIVPSLGRLDGAGRVVDHRPALVFGVDNIAAEQQRRHCRYSLITSFFTVITFRPLGSPMTMREMRSSGALCEPKGWQPT